MNEGNQGNLLNLYVSAHKQQFSFVNCYLDRASKHHHQQQQVQLLQSLIQQDERQRSLVPIRNQWNQPLLQPCGQQARPPFHIGSILPIGNTISTSAVASLNSDLQSQLLLSLADPPPRRMSLQTLEEEREQARHRARLHQISYTSSIDSSTRAPLPSLISNGAAISSDDSHDDQDRPGMVCASSPLAVGRGRAHADSTWESRFAELVEFNREHCHCNVPRRYKANPKLGVWVCSIRQQMARGTLKNVKVERLNEIGFSWRVIAKEGQQTTNHQISKMDNWIKNFQLLASIKGSVGKRSVPASNRKLCKWVGRQRGEMKGGTLSIEKQEKLNSIGFQWKPVNVLPS
ncbi:unnamed protein product [Cylindrotheca closterium]|uniref:Helicase-associated domain-containing protein n=1 Tax=Cylindrotheca closterium TaxID=2856 RepID=A0AAD2FJB8_9STRA|nr:unnamed protein product [Cylindrotheca closterium]